MESHRKRVIRKPDQREIQNSRAHSPLEPATRGNPIGDRRKLRDSSTDVRIRLFITTFLVLSSSLWAPRSEGIRWTCVAIFKLDPPYLSFVNHSFLYCFFEFRALRYLYNLFKDSSNFFALPLALREESAAVFWNRFSSSVVTGGRGREGG